MAEEKYKYSVLDSLEKLDFLDEIAEPVPAGQFYMELFDNGVDLQSVDDRNDKKGNVIAIGKDLKTGETKRYTVHAENDFEDLRSLPKEEFIFLSPISYFGKRRELKNARFMYAMAFDLDGVTFRKLENLIHQIEHDLLPAPTYIVDSGAGVHLYYKFVTPVPMFPAMREVLQELKTELTDLIWNMYTSEIKKKQFQSINQGFRVVGSLTKAFLLDNDVDRIFVGADADRRETSAYRFGVPVTLEYLQSFLRARKEKVDFDKVGKYNSKMTLQQAKEKFPEWYQRRIVDKLPAGQWQANRALYDWWIGQIKAGATGGHRYWCLYTLTAYAVKCGIPFEELKKDAYGLQEFLNTRDKQPFTKGDVKDALKLYKDGAIAGRLTRDYLSQQTAIPIPANKRNGRKQEIHIKIMTSTRDILYPEGEWRNKEGRPSKAEEVREWRLSYPDGRKIDCHRQTGISRTTIDKWWDVDFSLCGNEENHLLFKKKDKIGLPEIQVENGRYRKKPELN